MVVYADVLLAVNFVVNYLLLLLTARLCRLALPRGRLLAGAVLGALGALAIFVPGMDLAGSFFYKLALAAAMCLAAFGRQRGLWRGLLALLGLSFLFAGLMLALHTALAPRRLLVYNGVVYFDLTAGWLLGSCLMGYLLSRCLFAWAGRAPARGEEICLLVRWQGAAVQLRALLDSGNRLREPFSGLPVVVCHAAALAPLLPPGFSPGAGQPPPPGFRLVPFQGVGDAGVLPAFRPQQVLWRREGGSWQPAGEMYLAVTGRALGTRLQAVANPDILARHEMMEMR